MAVVKANAYGHGLERACAALAAADGFAVLGLHEALALRAQGWTRTILLLEGVFAADELVLAAEHDIAIVVHNDSQIEMLAKTALPRALAVFLKMNSGMNRLGLRPAQYRSAWTRLNALPQVDEISLMTHFSDADGPRGVAAQLAAFEAATQDLPGERSLSNSAAILRHMGPQVAARVRSDWVRPGILLYGASPDYPEHDAAHWGLQPTMSLRSRVIGVQQLQAGESVGYGSIYTAPAPQRIGIVACGYADGYLRASAGGPERGTPVLVDGVRTRTVGRVSMDLITVDLTPVPQAGMGSEVTLWGRALNGAVLPIDEVAQAGGSVGYELMCALSARVPVEVAA